METAATVSSHQQRQAGVTRRDHRCGIERGRRSKPDNRGWILYLDKCSNRQTDRYRPTVTDGQRCGEKQTDRKMESCRLLLLTEKTGQ